MGMATDFGRRVAAARRHKKLTQKQLAPQVGMSQSNLSELETVAHGSSKTAQIAQICGVNPYWLATGEGEMLAPTVVVTATGTAHGLARVVGEGRAVVTRPPDLAEALPVVLDVLMAQPPARWASLRAQLDQLMQHPEMRDDVLAELQALLSAPPGKRQAAA